VIALEVLYIVFNVVFIIPKVQKLTYDGVLDQTAMNEQGVSWISGWLRGLQTVAGFTTSILVGALALVVLFEWRVRSENKSFIRLAVLGTVAAALLVVVILTATSQEVAFTLCVPATGRLARPFAVDQVGKIDVAMSILEQAKGREDWKAMQEALDRAAVALENLEQAPPAIPALASALWKEPPSLEELRARVKAADESLRAVQLAIQAQDLGRLNEALKKFHEAFGPVLAASKMPGR
jgi:hypothetical protein